MILREFVRNVAYTIAGIPIIGKPVIFLLHLRRRLLSRRHVVKESATPYKYKENCSGYDDALKGILECLQRQENRIRILENKLKEKNCE